MKKGYMLHCLVIALIVACSLFLSVTALAVARRPPAPSDYPAGFITINGLADVKVLRQELTMDFRKTNGYASNTALLTAIYEIDCEDCNHPQLLQFIAGNVVDSLFRIDIDGRILLKDSVDTNDTWLTTANMPDSVQWKNKRIPYFYYSEKDNPIYYSSASPCYLYFTVNNLSAGRHVITITYVAQLSQWYHYDELTTYQSFAYPLQFSSVNGYNTSNNLHINIITPKGYEYTSNLPLEVKEIKNDTVYLQGYWSELPTNYISFTIHKDGAKEYRIYVIAQIAAWIILLIGCLWWIVAVVKRTYTHSYPKSVRVINYLVTLLVIFVQSIILLMGRNPITLVAALAAIVLAVVVVKRFFRVKHKTKLPLYYLNCLLYMFIAINTVYFLVEFGETSVLYTILTAILLLPMHIIVAYSAKRKKHKFIVQLLSNTFVAFVLTFGFFFIYFEANSLLFNMLNDSINPLWRSDGLIIMASPFIFLFAVCIVVVVNFIVIKIVKSKLEANHTL